MIFNLSPGTLDGQNSHVEQTQNPIETIGPLYNRSRTAIDGRLLEGCRGVNATGGITDYRGWYYCYHRVSVLHHTIMCMYTCVVRGTPGFHYSRGFFDDYSARKHRTRTFRGRPSHRPHMVILLGSALATPSFLPPSHNPIGAPGFVPVNPPFFHPVPKSNGFSAHVKPDVSTRKKILVIT